MVGGAAGGQGFERTITVMEYSSSTRSSLTFIVTMVAVWWVANTISTIGSKNVMLFGTKRDASLGGVWTSAFRDLRWVDLTALQHFVSAVVAVVWLKVVKRDVWPKDVSGHTRTICIAAVGNIAGNMATNAAYSLITSSTTQVVKACEPIFTFLLTVFLYNRYTDFNLSALLSVVIIVLGAWSFIKGDSSFNMWGLVAGMISNTAFPVRNIFLKNLSNVWDSPLQKFAVMSSFSVLFLLPVVFLKLVFNGSLPTIAPADSLMSSVFHCTYNMASITVLEHFSPVTHAILNLSKRAFVIATNIVYFHIPITLGLIFSVCILLLGCYLYQLHVKSKVQCLPLKAVVIVVTLLYLLNSKYHHLYADTKRSIKCSSGSGVPTNITTSWVFSRDIPEDVVANIATLVGSHPGASVHVYCGNTQCIHAISSLQLSVTHVEFLVVSKLVKDTPLDVWFAKQAFYKVLAGGEFEAHLHDVVRLALLWHHGGVYVDPMTRTSDVNSCHSSAWVSRGEGSPLDVAYFPRGHTFIHDLAIMFVNSYPNRGSGSIPFTFDFPGLVSRHLSSVACTDCPEVLDGIQLGKVDLPKSELHFGTLSYNSRVVGMSSDANLGDEVQGFPGLQFLPYRDVFLERDDLATSAGNESILAFFNAWWGSGRGIWPPPPNVHPILTSLHFSDYMVPKVERSIGYLKEREPIGCRDTGTMALMEKHNVKHYFSGCLTLMMTSPNVGGQKTDNIYIVDVKKHVFELFPTHIQQRGIRVAHNMEGPAKLDSLSRFTAAYDLMEQYSSAYLVITQRIHAALPCVAMGVPVIFINSPTMPGGGGSKTASSPRVVGLTSMFHTLDLYMLSEQEGTEWLRKFPWDDPPPNPDVSLVMRLRATAWSAFREHKVLYDVARKFGLIPLRPPAPPVRHWKFHLLFTTTNETNWLQQSVVPQQQTGGFNWRHMRSVESIFHHHPGAEVIVHSNTLSQDTFDVLTEAGYSIEVRSYDLIDLLRGSPAEEFIKKLPAAKKGHNWYSHETDLLRFLILYEHGGVYMDTDVIIVRPIESLPMNTLGWEDRKNISLNGAFMLFEKGSDYMRDCLREFAAHYNGGSWGGNGPGVLTRVYHGGGSGDVTAMSYHAFYMFSWPEITKQCFHDTEGKIFEEKMKIMKTEAYVVHLNNKVTASEGIEDNELKHGTICRRLLNAYCVLCNIVY